MYMGRGLKALLTLKNPKLWWFSLLRSRSASLMTGAPSCIVGLVLEFALIKIATAFTFEEVKS